MNLARPDEHLADPSDRQARGAKGACMTHVLHPGDVICVERGERVETLLGSCVAIVLTDARRSIAAVCHLVHAGAGATTAYGGCALQAMEAMLRARGFNARLCEAFVYGGGNMFPVLAPGDQHVGMSNVRWALSELAGRGMPVLAQDVGGDGYRRFAWTVGPGMPEVVQLRG
ncbi:chemotaxis protein CheD [Roseateles sp. BYS78W]|uniref:Chemotaxis protein CheD n=1 Tax=Pelomonas candidula TaxID=3299025 RepID=A0ABW7HE26_9BURK